MLTYKRFYRGIGLYWRTYRLLGLELRWDSQSCQIELWHETNPKDTNWLFVARLQKHNWGLGKDSGPYGIQFQLGPAILMIPKANTEEAI